MILYKGKLTKITELDDNTSPNNEPVGEVTEGEFLYLPEEDKPFVIVRNLTSSLRTSKIRKIISESAEEIVFKTLNSIYKLEYEIVKK